MTMEPRRGSIKQVEIQPRWGCIKTLVVLFYSSSTLRVEAVRSLRLIPPFHRGFFHWDQKEKDDNLLEATLEHTLLHSYKDEMISFMELHPEVFEEAIVLAMADRQPYSWRAAWLLWSCMDENDKRIRKYIRKIVVALQTKKDGHQRELLKILSRMELKEEYEVLLFDVCMGVWEQIHKDPSVRFTALKFMVRIAKKHPELSREIAFLGQDRYLESLSPGIKKSVLRLVREPASS